VKKKLTDEQYKKIIKDYHSDVISEEYDSEQIWDLAKSCVVELATEEDKLVRSYLISKGVKDLVGDFADDILNGRTRL